MGRLQDFIFPAYDVRFVAINDEWTALKVRTILPYSRMFLTIIMQGPMQIAKILTADRYSDLQELDVSTINELIYRIVIHKPEPVSGTEKPA